MAKPSNKTPDEKLRVVLSVLRGEQSASDAACRAGVAEQTVHNWKRQFLEVGRQGAGGRGPASSFEPGDGARGGERRAQRRRWGRRTFSCGMWQKGAEYLPPIEDLEMIRTQAQLTILRFCELIGVPRRSYHWRLAKHRRGEPPKGPWPASMVDRIEPVVAKYAAQ